MTNQVTVHMNAPAERVWALISDVTRTGDYSPETFEAEWLDGATGPSLGARFRGHVRRNGKDYLVYWTTCVVTACEPGRSFGFSVGAGPVQGLNNWLYELASSGDGVEVTESFAVAGNPLMQAYWKLLGSRRSATNLEGMRQTLERIKAVAEQG